MDELLTSERWHAAPGSAASALRYYESIGLISARGAPADGDGTSAACCAGSHSSARLSTSVCPWRRCRRRWRRLPAGRTPTKADWVRLSRQWRHRLEEQIAALEALRDGLTGCIGCGCLSLRSCSLYNPQDRDASAGPGARRLPPALRR